MKQRRRIKEGAYKLPKFKVRETVKTPGGEETVVASIDYECGTHWYLTDEGVWAEHELSRI